MVQNLCFRIEALTSSLDFNAPTNFHRSVVVSSNHHSTRRHSIMMLRRQVVSSAVAVAALLVGVVGIATYIFMSQGSSSSSSTVQDLNARHLLNTQQCTNFANTQCSLLEHRSTRCGGPSCESFLEYVTSRAFDVHPSLVNTGNHVIQ